MATAAAPQSSPAPSYPAFKVLRVEREGQVGILTLSNPAKLNAMGPDFWSEFPKAMEALGSNPEVRCIIVQAEGKAFRGGVELMSMGGTLQGGGGSGAGNMNPATSVAGRKRFLDEVRRLQDSITAAEKCPKPVIAAIHGACIGGGVDLATACDIRLATRDAKFSIRETRIAMVADVGTLQRLPRILGRGLAAELAYTGKDFSGQYAKDIHLVNEVFDTIEALRAGARKLAEEIAANSPLAVQGTKHVLRACEDKTVAEGLDYVALWNSAFLTSEDLTEAILAWMQKRPAKFKGR